MTNSLHATPGAAAHTDPLPLAQKLIRCASVTPADEGAQTVLATELRRIGFDVTALRFGAIENLFARIGSGGPHLCFAGHTDVVPAGDGSWTGHPFGGEVRAGMLYGRGACDMKGAIAAFAAAAAHHLQTAPLRGSISLLITGDEEGEAVDGTARVLQWMAENGQMPDFCIVGEPTNQARLGDVIKIGRRGSLTARLVVHGTQGHVAYPSRTDNPIHRLVRVLDALTSAPLDGGTEFFEPSTLQVTSIDVGNPASNVVPAQANAVLNIRFNDRHTSASLDGWLRATIARYVERFELTLSVSGESFLTKPGPQVAMLQRAVEEATGTKPRLDTGGGTSDARFIAQYCPVAEFGLVGTTMHQVDERVPLDELRTLAHVYRQVLEAFGV